MTRPVTTEPPIPAGQTTDPHTRPGSHLRNAGKGDETIPGGTTAVFHLDGGLMLSIYPRSELAKDAVIPLIAAKPGEFSIGHAVASRAEVDEVIAQAKAAGAAVTDSPSNTS